MTSNNLMIQEEPPLLILDSPPSLTEQTDQPDQPDQSNQPDIGFKIPDNQQPMFGTCRGCYKPVEQPNTLCNTCVMQQQNETVFFLLTKRVWTHVFPEIPGKTFVYYDFSCRCCGKTVSGSLTLTWETITPEEAVGNYCKNCSYMNDSKAVCWKY